MSPLIKVDENTCPNKAGAEERKMKSALSWSLILNSGDSSTGGTSNKRRKRSVSRCKSRVQPCHNFGLSSTLGSSNHSNSSLPLSSATNSKAGRETMLKKRRDWMVSFQINRVFFEEFPIYRREYRYPSNTRSTETPAKELGDLLEDSVREPLKLVPRRLNMEADSTVCRHPSLFEGKKVCLLADEEYLFHSKRQLILKLRWYGAKTLDYYSSRADYVVCSSTYSEVMGRLNHLSAKAGRQVGGLGAGFQAYGCNEGGHFENLRGVRIGQQIKLTELELLEFLGEELEIALEMMSVSELGRVLPAEASEGLQSQKRLELQRPRSMWEFVGNKDCADELYNSLLHLRLQCEDQEALSRQGVICDAFGGSDELQRSYQMDGFHDDLCGIFVLISPGNIGSQICAELVAFGCGYDIKVYRGSDVVEPIVKQWKKGHFFKLFEDSESPPVCTIMTDCSGIIKAGDILKIKSSYYSTAFFREEGGTAGHRRRAEKCVRPQGCQPKLSSAESPQESRQTNKRQNPGAIVFILDEISEAAQFLLGHCNNSTRSFGCSRSYALCKLDGGTSAGQAVKVLRFSGLTKSAVACKMFTKFKSLALINILIGQFGPNIIKISQLLHWVHLLDSLDLASILGCISLSYTPILFDSCLEMPLLMIQKCLLSQEETSMREEIWGFSSTGLIEDQAGAFETLLKVLHDFAASIIACLDPMEESSTEHEPGGPGSAKERAPRYASGFEPLQSPMGESSATDGCSILAKFLRDLTEMDSKYQIENAPHLVLHSPGGAWQQSQSLQSQSLQLQQEHRATCEAYFTSLYSIALFSLTAILRQNIPNRTLCSERVINLVNDKLLKYSPVNTGYDKNLTNYYNNKRNELSSTWRFMEYLFKRHVDGASSIVTWRSVCTDSSIPNLYHRGEVGPARHYDIVAYVPSRIPKLSIRIPDFLKGGQ
ncbi:hypothetical protein OJ252_3089 [Cryptosporidium canis]|uniref:Uncharacterized protein n=1 Tax=Cryptosporidium canis TaxID=195482 RepID=A0ABQ8P3D2_9CRYT|nr:hypothetical protein OJ252_3089 [Cryptosporidium canis]